MMMPANFSAVAENEMTYVMGGASLVDYLAPAMGAAQWQNVSKNLVTVIGNQYIKGFLQNTVGQVFTGHYVPGDVIDAFGTTNRDIWYGWATKDVTGQSDAGVKAKAYVKGALNIGLNVVGNLAAIYNLGFGTVKNAVSEDKWGFAGTL